MPVPLFKNGFLAIFVVLVLGCSGPNEDVAGLLSEFSALVSLCGVLMRYLCGLAADEP